MPDTLRKLILPITATDFSVRNQLVVVLNEKVKAIDLFAE
jgi:hypothetical protein